MYVSATVLPGGNTVVMCRLFCMLYEYQGADIPDLGLYTPMKIAVLDFLRSMAQTQHSLGKQHEAGHCGQGRLHLGCQLRDLTCW